MHLRPVWDLVIPVKGGAFAKSRLGAGPDLALAFALDCVGAALGSAVVGEVLVVTADPHAERTLSGLAAGGRRARVLRQPPSPAGLRPALDLGLSRVRGRCAVLLADLPALLPADLTAVLDRLGRDLRQQETMFVPDAAGTGTVLLAGRDARRMVHRFGPGSAAAHEAVGAGRAEVAAPRLRVDVDTPADLLTALDLGAGAHTRARVGLVQATVLRFDPATAEGEVVLDDGTSIPLAQSALTGSGLRHLRPGQRVTCAVGPDRQRVIAVRINGIGDPLG